jgi:formylmethanofuran dehydrogenase subunit A
MKKIKLLRKFHSMGIKNEIYYYSEMKKSYGYDVLNRKGYLAFGFGEQLKNEFDNYYKELNITPEERIKLKSKRKKR